jgi:hypothetical protein
MLLWMQVEKANRYGKRERTRAKSFASCPPALMLAAVQVSQHMRGEVSGRGKGSWTLYQRRSGSGSATIAQRMFAGLN